MRSLFIFMILLILTSAGPSTAQDVTGSIDGWILDREAEAPVPHANVTVTGKTLQTSRSALSMGDGYFRVIGIPVGEYVVTVEHLGHATVSYDEVIVQLGKTTSIGRVKLAAQATEMEEVVIIGRSPILDFSTTEFGDNLSSDLMARLPTPRDYREVVSYVPHANISFLGDGTNIAGSTGSENQYFIEGVNVTDPFLGSGGTRLPQNFVREVQVKQGGYEAEYGKATGGIINVITHSGSNEFSGQVFGFASNNNVASDSRRGVSEFRQSDFYRYDLGVSLGGAVVRDKLWYFLAYNPTFESESLFLPGYSFLDDDTVSHLFAGKLTWNVDPSTSVDLAVFGDPTHRDRIGGNVLITPLATTANPDPLLSDVTTGAVTASLSGQRFLGDRAIVEASVSRVDANNESKAATEVGRTEISYHDTYNNVLSGGNQFQFDHHATRWAGDAKATLFLGSHELKLGAAYENIRLDEFWKCQTPDGRDGIVRRIGSGTWLSTTLLNDFEVSHRLPSVFVQDSWRVTNRLRLNAGLRWDGIYVVNPEGDVAQSINDGYQPRAGFSYRLDDAGFRQVSGSYGRFYEQLPMIASSWYFGDFYQTISYWDQDPRPGFTATPTQILVLDNASYPSDSLDGQYLDEFTLGYEQRLGRTWKAGVRGIYRNLGNAIETSVLPGFLVHLGNPGRGSLDHLPDPERRYTALEFSLENTFGRKLHLVSAYVLSRSRGNYPGVYDTDADNPHAHVTNSFWDASQISEGLLPNDRTHVFKTYGSYAFDVGLAVGAFFTWQSGTPLSEYGGTWIGPKAFSHLVERGSAGRTPSIWDANLRLSYDLSTNVGALDGTRPRLLLDVFHLFGQREIVDVDQVHYFEIDPATGEQMSPNPNYGKPLAYQPPMTIRFGVETSF